MNKIKIVGALVFVLLIVLAVLSGFIANENRENSASLNFIHEQKAFTQEISKSIFYTYRNGEKESKTLDVAIKKYITNAKVNETEFTQNRVITTLWNIFYADVQKFENQQKITTGYNSVITAKLVNRIYHNNVLLVNEFDKLIALKQGKYNDDIDTYKQIQYVLFVVLILLLIYLFTQVREVIEFIHKFSKTSNSIIKNATIKGVEPLEIKPKESKLKEITKNYNQLVARINSSIEHTSKSINITTKSLEEVEQNIENFMELLATMEDKQSDEVLKKEDVVIEVLEKLGSLNERLNQLRVELDSLVK